MTTKQSRRLVKLANKLMVSVFWALAGALAAYFIDLFVRKPAEQPPAVAVREATVNRHQKGGYIGSMGSRGADSVPLNISMGTIARIDPELTPSQNVERMMRMSWEARRRAR